MLHHDNTNNNTTSNIHSCGNPIISFSSSMLDIKELQHVELKFPIFMNLKTISMKGFQYYPDL